MKKKFPTLYKSLGIYLLLIATNCIVLAIPIINIDNKFNLVKSIVHSLGSGVGFALALLLMSSIREKLERADIPEPLKGLGITFVIAALLSLAFLGFGGLIKA